MLIKLEVLTNHWMLSKEDIALNIVEDLNDGHTKAVALGSAVLVDTDEDSRQFAGIFNCAVVPVSDFDRGYWAYHFKDVVNA